MVRRSGPVRVGCGGSRGLFLDVVLIWGYGQFIRPGNAGIGRGVARRGNSPPTSCRGCGQSASCSTWQFLSSGTVAGHYLERPGKQTVAAAATSRLDHSDIGGSAAPSGRAGWVSGWTWRLGSLTRRDAGQRKTFRCCRLAAPDVTTRGSSPGSVAMDYVDNSVRRSRG